MSSDNGKIRAKVQDGGIAVRAIIRHPMETGARKPPGSEEPVPRHYVQEVVCEHNGQVVLAMDWGWGISANPYVAFHIQQGKPGDTVAIRWTDDQGVAGQLETSVV